MGMSWGEVLGQGLIGSVAGAATAAAKNADDELKARVLRQRDEFLSKLKMGEYEAKAAFDDKRKKADEAETAQFYKDNPRQTKPADTFTDTLGDEATGAAAGGIINDARQESEREYTKRLADKAKETGKKSLIEPTSSEATRMRELDERREERGEARKDRYEDRDEAREDRRAAREEARAERGAARAESAAARKEAREQAERLAKMAADRDWKVDADGYYRRPDGTRVTERVRVEGRGYEEVPIKAPASKVAGNDRVMGENLDSINRRIEAAERKVAEAGSAGDATAEAQLQKLLDEKDELLGKKKRAPSNSSSSSSGGGKPWQRQWKAN